jgi:glycosyltransferase involved in cell wall biosynthesis
MKYLLFMITFSVTLIGVPRVSIITSVYKGDQFIEGFMEDIVRQTIFNQCELIMINANSPGNEEQVIRKYMKKYSNIIYIKLDHDPGMYEVWNIAIKMSKSEYLTNANLDDRLKENCYEVHARALDKFSDVDLVYSGCYRSYIPNETFKQNNHQIEAPHSQYCFNKKRLIEDHICYPNNHPMWRKSIHRRYGLFNKRYKSAGDLEMWVRAAGFGNAQFRGIKGFYGLCFMNPQGLSTSKESNDEIEREEIRRACRKGSRLLLKKIEFIL